MDDLILLILCQLPCAALTLMRIFPRRLWGLGRVAESLCRMSPTSSLSPKMSRRYWAIFFCCWMLQWFSMDRMTGYLPDEYLERRKKRYLFRIQWNNIVQNEVLEQNVCKLLFLIHLYSVKVIQLLISPFKMKENTYFTCSHQSYYLY